MKSKIQLGKEKVLSEKLGLDRCDLYSGAIVLDRRWLRSLQPRIHFPTALLHGGLHCWEGGSKPQRYIYISISWGAGWARRLPYIYFDYNSHPHQALTRNWLGRPSFNIKCVAFLRVLGYKSFQNSILHVTACFFSPIICGANCK